MQNGQKRRTFIGTPYWMAPEVTTGTYIPYDSKADIWSTGITCIELAELVPPCTHLAPMRAVLEIAKNPPPKLKNPGNWSKDFNDFIAECLVKDPEKRKPAADLLKHPFLVNCASKRELVDLINKIQQAETDFRAKPDEESSDKTPKGLTAPVSEINSGTGEINASLSPSPDPSRLHSESVSNGTPNPPQVAVQRRPSDAPPLPPQKENKEEEKPFIRPVSHKDDRPRTLRKTLKKSNAPQNIEDEKRVAHQLRELKKLQAKQLIEAEAQNKQQKKS